MLTALIGGTLIGLAASVLLLFLGRIAGISGIATQALVNIKALAAEDAWRWLFLLGLPLGAWLVHTIADIPVPQGPNSGVALAVMAGLLVGYGTARGSGCTSGHGICGIARLAKRSFVATACFMTAGIVSTFVARHILNVI